MTSLLDLTDQTFGHLKVIERVPGHTNPVLWRCECLKCGGDHEASTAVLRNGKILQCAACQGLFKWDDEKDQIVHQMKASGKTAKDIAAVLDCNPVTVHRRVAKLGLSDKHPVKEHAPDHEESRFRKYMNTPCSRKCLNCGKVFNAHSRTNRLCFACDSIVHGAAFV